MAFFAAAIVFDLVVLSWGETPSSIARQLLAGTWGNAYGVGQVFFKATSILIAAIAARAALRAGLFNIGVDGAIAVSALAVGAIGAKLSPTLSPFLAWPLLTVVAFVVAALWTLPQGVLKARFGAHEVISGIMLNKIGVGLVGYLLARGLAAQGSVHTVPLPRIATLTRFGDLRLRFFRLFTIDLHALHGSALNVAVFVAVAVAFGWSFLARRTIFGRELAAVGASPSASRAAGIPLGRRFVQALALSGGIAGLTALNDVMGYKGYAEEGLSAGVGFTGLAAALLAGESALAAIAASLLFATLSQGRLSINARVPMELVDVLVAVLILFVGAERGVQRLLHEEA